MSASSTQGAANSKPIIVWATYTSTPISKDYDGASVRKAVSYIGKTLGDVGERIGSDQSENNRLPLLD
jgi:hypothetical protein